MYTPDFLSSIDHGLTQNYINNCVKPDSAFSLLNKMLYIDTKTWLPDDLLVKADKITMANSIELRVPLLDHKILEFAGTLPENFKVRNFKTKRILKQAFTGIVPTEILNRKKTGFPIPYQEWMRNEHKDAIHDLLLSSGAMSREYFERKTVENILSDNVKNSMYPKEVFTLAVLELWLQTFTKTEKQ